MKRIDKSLILATAYHEWLDQLEDKKEDHDPYSSNHRFHKDVLMNLVACQGGLCAYTESRVGDESWTKPDFWEKGRYKKADHPPQLLADIEHFDPDLKEKKGWLWSNLFAVNSVINQRVKKDQAIDPILKPDGEDYDPFRLLDYVYEPDESDNSSDLSHFFVPHPGLAPDQKRRVMRMIEVLGINHQVIRRRRKDTFKLLVDQLKIGLSVSDDSPEEFPTAWAMIQRSYS